MSSPAIKLTYFDIQGAAEKVRLAFHLAGVPFEDARVAFKDWGALKPTTPYGQLPIMSVDGGAPFAQSPAMLRWAGRQGDGSLYPVDDMSKQLEVEEMIGLAEDWDKAWMPCLYMGMAPHKFGYPKDFGGEEKAAKVKALREGFVAEEMPKRMAYYAKHLEGKQFFCGDKPTIADCWILPQLRAYTLGHIDHVPTDCLDKYDAVKAWVDRMMALPAVKAHYDAQEARKKN